MASEILSAINGDNLDLSEAQANLMSTGGILLALLGIMGGSTVMGAISTIVGMTAVSSANDLRREIEEEKARRAALTSKYFRSQILKYALIHGIVLQVNLTIGGLGLRALWLVAPEPEHVAEVARDRIHVSAVHLRLVLAS